MKVPDKLIFNCPACGKQIDPKESKCPDGHQYEFRDGILRLMSPEFAGRLLPFLKAFEDHQKSMDYTPPRPEQYEKLPFGKDLSHPKEWKSRQKDMGLLPRFIRERKGLKILEIGSWNGWLSHHLAKEHSLTAIDIFADEVHGLGSQKFYDEDWLRIQTDLSDLSIFPDEYFDLVIFNHCLHFLPEPRDLFKSAKRIVKPFGRIWVMAMPFLQNPEKKQQELQQRDDEFREKYGMSLFLYESKGYFSNHEFSLLIMDGLDIRPYPGGVLRYLVGVFRPGRPWLSYGSFKKESGLKGDPLES